MFDLGHAGGLVGTLWIGPLGAFALGDGYLPQGWVFTLGAPGSALSLMPTQVVEDGYEFFAKRQLVTLFSAPNYCGEFDNAGAMMSVDETLMCSFQVGWGTCQWWRGLAGRQTRGDRWGGWRRAPVPAGRGGWGAGGRTELGGSLHPQGGREVGSWGRRRHGVRPSLRSPFPLPSPRF